MKRFAVTICAILVSQNLCAATGPAKGALLYKNGPVAACIVDLALPSLGDQMRLIDYYLERNEDTKRVMVHILAADGYQKAKRYGVVVSTSDADGWQYARIDEEIAVVAKTNVSPLVESFRMESSKLPEAIATLDAAHCL